MSLSESLSSMQTTRLMKMNALPSTEDLRYMLVTAKESRKMVELPFKHSNGNNFCIKVVPPQAQFGPKWTFGKGEDGHSVMWTRESIDVMMIQNKMKIDSISTLDAPAPVVEDRQAIVFSQTQTGNNIPAFKDPLANPFQQQPEGGPDVSGYTNAPNLSAHGWMPQTTPKAGPTLPPPVELDPETYTTTLNALANPETGLSEFWAFTYFLQREFAHFEKFGTKLAAIVFDFRDKDSGEAIELPVEALHIVNRHLLEKCGLFDIASRMPTGEFIILLTGYGANEAMSFAEMLWKSMTDDFYSTFGEDPRSLAVGVSSIPDQCRDPGVLVSTAQSARDQARRTSRSHLLFSPF